MITMATYITNDHKSADINIDEETPLAAAYAAAVMVPADAETVIFIDEESITLFHMKRIGEQWELSVVLDVDKHATIAYI